MIYSENLNDFAQLFRFYAIVDKIKEKKSSLMDFYSIWRDKEKVDKIKKMLEKDRKKAKLKGVKF